MQSEQQLLDYFKQSIAKEADKERLTMITEAKEIRELTTAEIEQEVKSLKEELFNLRFQLATGQLENTARISQVRKSIARMKTVIRQREISANN